MAASSEKKVSRRQKEGAKTRGKGREVQLISETPEVKAKDEGYEERPEEHIDTPSQPVRARERENLGEANPRA